jgi:hypothetical protein
MLSTFFHSTARSTEIYLAPFGLSKKKKAFREFVLKTFSYSILLPRWTLTAMTEYQTILDKNSELFDSLDEACKLALDSAEIENIAATNIQRTFRGSLVRAKRTQKFECCRSIQRVYRGHLARLRCDRIAEAKRAAVRMGFFHYQAHIVQKSFRGYYSRRYYHDFYARKAYISNIMHKSDALKKQLQEHRANLERKQAAERETDARQEFEKVTENLHHLLSTSSQAGIYNSPYLQGNVPTAFNVPVEDHLKRGMSKYLSNTMRRKGSTDRNRGASGQVVSRQSTRRSTTASSKVRSRSRVSVRAGSQYGVEKEQQRWEEKFSRLRRLSPKPFSAGGREQLDKFEGGISIGTPYEELWKIARSSRDPALEDKTKRVSSAPFVTAMKKRGRAFDDYADDAFEANMAMEEQF